MEFPKKSKIYKNNRPITKNKNKNLYLMNCKK